MVIAPALTGRCVDSDGKGIEGAMVSWSTLKSEGELGHPRAWDTVNWTDLDASTRVAWSDRQGRFTFESIPTGAENRPTATWMTKVGYRAAGYVLGAESAELRDCKVTELVSEQGPLIEVVDQMGNPIGGAALEVFGVAPVESPALAADDALARRIFHRIETVTLGGQAELFAFDGPVGVRASKGGLRSHVWLPRSLRNERHRLVLAPTFAVAGVVRMEDGGSPTLAAHVRCDAEDDVQSHYLTQIRLLADGVWGPVDLPLCPGVIRFRISVEGGDLVPVDHYLDPPAVGSVNWVQLMTRTGLDLDITVRDDAGNAVPGARVVTSNWYSGDWAAQALNTDSAGHARLGGFVAGEVEVEVEARGYVAASTKVLIDASPETRRVGVTVHRAGRVRGRCFHDSQPVARFEIVYWQGERLSFQTVAFVDRADGAFELDSVPLGDVWLFASGYPHAQSRAQVIHVTADAAANVVLELPNSNRGRGRVVDAATLAPVVGARVQVYSGDGPQLMTPIGAASVTDGDGRFEVDGIGSVSTGYMIEADGYAMRIGRTAGEAGVVTELGDIAIVRRQALDVQLVSRAPRDFTKYTLEIFAQDWNPPLTPFDGSGRVRVDALAPGFLHATVHAPDGTQRLTKRQLPPGRDWRIEIPIDGDATLAIEVVDERGQRLETPHGVVVSFLDAGGMRVELEATKQTNGDWRVDGIDTGTVTIDVRDSRGLLGSRSLGLRAGENEVRIRVARERATARLVDSKGAPVPAATVRLTSVGAPMWNAGFVTDAQGCGPLPMFEIDDVSAVVFHPEAGVAAGISVRKPRDAGDVVEIVLDADSEARIHLRDGEAPLPNARVIVYDGARALDLRDGPTDASGTFTAEKLVRGRYLAMVHEPSLWVAEATFEVDANPTDVTLQVRRTGALELTVVDAHGEPAAGVEVGLASGEFGEDVAAWFADGRVRCSTGALRSGADGRLRVDGLPRGEYRWTIGAQSGVASVPPHALGSATLKLAD